MKKKLLAATMCVCLTMSLFGCEKKEETNKETTKTDTSVSSSGVKIIDDTKKELNILDYVELSDYKGLELTKEIKEVTQEDVQTYMESNPVEVDIEGVVVQDGDVVIIDYVGKKDGVEFSGGKASNSELEIGSGTFIEGFESGLIGVKAGETVDLNLTFPENYPAEELAGADVVFTVTVNKITRQPELKDEWFVANTSYKTVAEYQAVLQTELEKQAEETAMYQAEAAALDKVVSASKVNNYYKSLITEGENQYENYIASMASAYGMQVSELLEAYSMTQDDYDKEKNSQGENYAMVGMIVQAIAKDAGLSTEDEAYQKLLKENASLYGFEVEDFVKIYGETLVEMSVMSEYVMDYLVDNATVTEKKVSAEEETTTAASAE